MYYQLHNGNIMTVRDMHIAFEILTGEPVDTNNTKSVQKYNAWLKANPNIKRVIYDPNNLSLEELVAGGCILEAVRRYREDNKCTLREARDAIHTMKEYQRRL